jgi:hypothetical protein
MPDGRVSRVRFEALAIVYAETLEAAGKAGEAFLLKRKKRFPGLVASLEEVGENPADVLPFPASPWVSLRTDECDRANATGIPPPCENSGGLSNKGARCARVLRALDQRTDEPLPHLRLPDTGGEEKVSRLKETNFMTS